MNDTVEICLKITLLLAVVLTIASYKYRLKNIEAGFRLLAKDDQILPHFKNTDEVMKYYIELAKKEGNDE
jgi:hypothetical protein